jgi:hypothetical protein
MMVVAFLHVKEMCELHFVWCSICMNEPLITSVYGMAAPSFT